MSWQQAFLAVSTLLGEPLDAAMASLDDGGAGMADDDLASLARPARAAATARAAVALVAELEGARLA